MSNLFNYTLFAMQEHVNCKSENKLHVQPYSGVITTKGDESIAIDNNTAVFTLVQFSASLCTFWGNFLKRPNKS